MTLFDDYRVNEPDIVTGNLWTPKQRHTEHSNENMLRPFIGWDGEGYTDEWGIHHYWLIRNSIGGKIVAPPGRSIHRHNITRLFLQTHAAYPKAIHSGFALGYDFTCILRGSGITPSQLTEIYSSQVLRDNGYVYKVMMGKQLTVWQESADNTGSRFNLQDTWGFFQRSFVKALDEYFNKDWPNRDLIIEMKKQRGNFDREHDEEVDYYCSLELELFVELMEELRDRLYAAGMPISRWYGPGALANGLFQQWKVKKTIKNHYQELPELAEASRYAYAGGRFELLKPGHTNQPVFQYDINSAYPYAIAQLPNLAIGEWKHIRNPEWDELNAFSVVRLSWDTAMGGGKLFDTTPSSLHEVYPESIPFPLWRRTRQGQISYPSYGIHGWYWMPEVSAAIDYSRKQLSKYQVEYNIEEAWVYEVDPEYYYTLTQIAGLGFEVFDEMSETELNKLFPYWRVAQLYKNRQKLKALGNGAHIGIKLGLNSLYGKFAQQIGWNPKTGEIPAYHNLALAGWITAMARARLLDAISLDPSGILATETDAVFSLRPLDLPVSNRLGEWDATVYDDLYYFASGFRFGIIGGEVSKPATRGIPAADISLDSILQTVTGADSIIEVTQQQFISLRWAVSMNRGSEVGNWRSLPKNLRVMCEDLNGKRVHDFDCPCCYVGEAGIRQYGDGIHLTIPNARDAYRLSFPHKVAWIDGNTDNQKQDAEIDSLFE